MTEPTQTTGYIALVGTIVTGFRAYGPFAEYDRAAHFVVERRMGAASIMPLYEWQAAVAQRVERVLDEDDRQCNHGGTVIDE